MSNIKKLMTLTLGLFSLRQNPVFIDERGGHWVYNLSHTAVIGYNYICGQYAGHYVKFSQAVSVALMDRLEESLDSHTPNLTGLWQFNPDIIANFEKVDLIIK